MSTNSTNPEKVSLAAAANRYLASETDKTDIGQVEVTNFVRLYGASKNITSIEPNDVAGYADQLSATDPDYAVKIKQLKSFFRFVKKEGWSGSENLGNYIKPKKVRVKQTPGLKVIEPVTVTREGLAAMKAELEELKSKRVKVIEDIRRAAADKDFRENAPYHAAREQKSHLDGRIMELEETLKCAVVAEETAQPTQKAGVGDTVVLHDLKTNEKACYTLVGPREVDALKGRISGSSPIGKAVMEHGPGEIIEIQIPAGKVSYRIEQVNRQ